MHDTDGRPRVLVVEDHDLVAETLRHSLEREADLEVVGIVGSIAAALRAVEEYRPTVVVMDYGLPDGTGADATRQIKAAHPEIEVVMLTGLSSGATLAEALEAGCSGFVAKEAHFNELVVTIRKVVSGQVQVPADLMADLVSHLRPQPSVLGTDLTAREREVLKFLADGCSTEEMVGTMFVSVHTVRNHVRNILSKLGARSRLEAVAVALRLGIVAKPT